VGAFARHASLWLVWALALFWLWMLLVGEWNGYEWVAAACAAAVAGAVLEAIRSLDGLTAIVPLRRIPPVLSALAMVPVDFGIVTLVLVRSIFRRRIATGEFVVRESKVVRRGARGRGDQAWTTLVANFSPNAYVIAFEDDGATVVLHDLVPNPSSESPA
jgi:hypothetical protein